MARLKDKAARLFGRGRYDKAVLAYREVVASDPRDMGSRLRLGDAYRRLDKTGAALACYREVADFYARDGMLLKAIAACKLVLEVAPDHQDTQVLLADLYARRLGKTDVPGPDASSVEEPKVEKASEREAIEIPATVESTDDFVIEGSSTPSVEVAGSEGDWSAPAPSAVPEEIEVERAMMPPVEQEDIEEDLNDRDDPFIVHLDGDDDEGVEIDLDALDDEEIDVGGLEPPPPPPQPEQRALPTIPLFSDLDHDAFIEILERMTYREMEPGTTILEEGAKGESFFVVVSGSLRVSRRLDGDEMELARLGEGHFFGEMALLSDRPRTATVTAETEASLFEIDRALLDDLRERYPAVKEALERFYRQRLLGNLFATSPVFRPFEKQERRRLMERFLAVEVGAGTRVIEEGIPSDGLYLVLSGELVVLRGTGFEEMTLCRLHEGDVFGEMSLINRSPATATVKALRKTVLLRLPREAFAELMMSHPQILEVVSKMATERQEQTAEILGRLDSSAMNLDLDDDALVML